MIVLLKPTEVTFIARRTLLPTSDRRSSAVIRCPSRGHISETKQERPTVTTEHYIQGGLN